MSSKKVSLQINFSVVSIVLLTLSILISTGIWNTYDPSFRLFGFFPLWYMLDFRESWISAILTILFLPALVILLIALLFLTVSLLIGAIVYFIANRN